MVTPLGGVFWWGLQSSRSARPPHEVDQRAEPSARWRPALAAALVASQFALLDAAFRGPRGWTSEPRVLFDVATSIALGLALVMLARSRASRALLALVASAVLVLQLLVFRYYHTPLDVQVVASAIHARQDVRQVLLRATPVYVISVLAVAALEYALLALVHRRLARVRSSRSSALGAVLSVAALGGLAGVAPRRATPEIRAAHALTALAAHREPAVSSAVTLPPLHAERGELPSILFVLTESVRADDYRGSGDAPTAPETAALTRGRTDFSQLRSVSSYTAVSLSAILTGRTQEGSRDAILRSPTLFDFAHAARDSHGRRPTVGYFSSQARTIFETDQVHAAVDRFATVETTRGHDVEDDPDYADLPLDRDIVDLFVKEIPALPAPSVVMLHFIGTHAPYFVDPKRAPFEPYDHVVTWSGMPKLLNAYRDSIYDQDRTLARAVSAFLASAGTRPWLIVFTSDHGEAFGEHGAIHHGANLLDEQVHVPAWIASGNGALTEAQSRALVESSGRFLTHLDLLPTILDALGLLDNFGVAEHRAAMPGRSLLRPYEPRAPIPITNCTGMFPCPLNTWGMYAGDRKLVARAWDGGWYCMAVGGPEERAIDGDAACDRLRELSRSTFPLLPNGTPNR
jgi:glucan phosphoethanolaminetransferase (alkaline phosphatase superfamily)